MKTILGVEAYLTDKLELGEKVKPRLYHQTILVQDAVGYKNLMRLTTKSNEIFYYRPRATLPMLEEHAEGLILLTGCPSSMIQKLVVAGETRAAGRLLDRFAAAFPGRLYVELQYHESSVAAADWLVRAASKRKLPVVVTNDAHYVDPEDRPLHDWMLKNKRKGKGEDEPVGYGEGFHMTTREEAKGYLFARHPWLTSLQVQRVLDTTVEIAERVDFQMPRSTQMLPSLWGDEVESRRRMRVKAVEGTRRLGLHKKKAYVERLRRELQVVEGLGYVDYFHCVSDMTTWARKKGIFIGPRGSVCGSLLAYVLGITTIDPLIHGTMFERFLHEQKKTMPDVDLDIDARYQDEVRAAVLKKFSPYAYPIIAYGRTGAGNIAIDLIKGFPNIDKGLFYSLRKGLSEMRYGGRVLVATEEDIRKFLNPKTLAALEEKIPWLVRGLTKMYSALRYVGKHPGGVCFVSGDHTEYFAQQKAGDRMLTSYMYLDLEYMNLMKLDFLGVKAISCVADVTKAHEIEPRDIPLDDEEAYRRFSAGDVVGIFQFETYGAAKILKEIQPDNFSEVAAATALNRPGVSVNLQKYVDGKDAGRGKVAPAKGPDDFAGIVREVLAPTFGAIVFQEQIVRILRAAGMTWQEGDSFLKAIKAHNMMYSASFEESKGRVIMDRFVELLAAKGFNKETARAFADRIALYSFNLSHATAYAMVAYWQMYLRVHFPLEFWCAMLRQEGTKETRWAYEQQAIKDGCVLLPPNINGTAIYEIEDGAIRVGTSTIHGIGEKAARVLELNRPYRKAADVLKIEKRILNARVKRALLEAGALETDKKRIVEAAIHYNQTRRDQNLGDWKHRHYKLGTERV